MLLGHFSAGYWGCSNLNRLHLNQMMSSTVSGEVRWGLMSSPVSNEARWGFDMGIPPLGNNIVEWMLRWKWRRDWFPHGWETAHQHCWMASVQLIALTGCWSFVLLAVWVWPAVWVLYVRLDSVVSRFCVHMNEWAHLLCRQSVFFCPNCVCCACVFERYRSILARVDARHKWSGTVYTASLSPCVLSVFGLLLQKSCWPDVRSSGYRRPSGFMLQCVWRACSCLLMGCSKQLVTE